MFATLFLALGTGAIAQVVLALWGVLGKGAVGPVLRPLNAAGILAGMLVMYGTGLLVA
jgi:hypothetical protein